ncbi:MAG: short-chain dehydrogenase [Terrimonas sp.]|uniref:short-chain dehydrogenase n=1 Tax=Terrimonas sp. TaxID=1914338 RepID=UPI000926DE21|nr:short-chain dehydrogenase [Terrimonas sp.]MBN8788342.1 short-chain dehydrogenase [Terrimonas sp.]OJY93002.1 MAG: short-chain dehydrogenase [Sphingobacteriales bacterium 40-81]PVD49480.1 short-chain dehydrogenase [Terrimonas sp.]
MDIERIERYIKPSIRNNATIDIHFKGRSPVTGLFIRATDYNELKSKNFWRVVQISQLQKWSETNDINVARIFNGASFTSLTETKL